MPLGEHLRELRRRLLWAALGLLVGAVVGWFLYDPVFDAMAQPLRGLEERGQNAAINFGTIGSAFDMKMKISVFIGVFVSSPWWIGQIWAFLAPGLTRREKLYTLSFVGTGALLFLAGGTLAWFVLPNAVHVLTAFTPDSALNLMDARTYFSFFMRVILVFGAAFLLPLVMVGMNFLGLVTGRSLLTGWRWAVLLAFTFTAFANPLPDAWSMIAMALPICGLYFAAVGVALLHDRRKARRLARENAELNAALRSTPPPSDPG